MSKCCHYKFQYACAAQKKGKLSENAVRDIRRRYDEGIKLAKIASAYGISRPTVNNIGLRKVYKWVAEAPERVSQAGVQKI